MLPLGGRSAPVEGYDRNFLRGRAEESQETDSRVGFLFTSALQGAEGDLDDWIEHEIFKLEAGEKRRVPLSGRSLER